MASQRRMSNTASIMRSYWLQQALSREGEDDTAPLTGELSVDVCIVGGGFTGLWTALRIKALEPALDVVIIERDICGGGASGRNGGFCMSWMSKAATVLKICGAQEGSTLLRASQLAVSEIGGFCRDPGLDAHFRHDGWLWTASNRAQMDAWSDTVEALDKLGLHPFEAVSSEAMAERTGSARHRGGVFEISVATLQPALLARGLRRAALAQGVRIFETSPLMELVREPRPGVKTRRGAVRADCVVLALNAWAHELPEFRRTILPVAVDALITEPAPERLAYLGLDNGTAISDSRIMVNYYRSTIDGRLSWGRGGSAIPFAGRLGSRFDGPTPCREMLRGTLESFYPSLADVPIAAAWRGPATRTATGLPFFGRLPRCPAVVYGHGYTGNGVGPSYLGGRILASLALGLDDEWSNNGFTTGPHGAFPPEPFRYIGGNLVRRAVLRRDHAEDQGRTPSRIDRFLTSLAPAGLVGSKEKT